MKLLNKNSLLILFLSPVLFTSFQVNAELVDTGIAFHLAYGEDGNTSGDTRGVKLAYQGYFDTFKKWAPDLEFITEASFNYFHLANTKIDESKHNDLFIISLAPIFRYPVYKTQSVDCHV